MTRPLVIKVGGSLLSHADAPAVLNAWLATKRVAYPSRRLVLIVGGGEPVDWLRRVDRQHPLGDKAAHWSAITMMDANAAAIAGWFPGVEFVSDWAQLLAQAASPGATLFAAKRFLTETEPNLPGRTLPIGWHVTSDSIAARVAARLSGDLMLLKSGGPHAKPSSSPDWRQLAADGVVDSFLPELIGEVRAATIENIEPNQD